MTESAPAPIGGRSRLLLALAAAAIAFAAADTYVVVLALPEMMASVGLDIDELQKAAPIVSGFLLGYVGILPLVGRISDLRGRVPVLIGSMLVFAVGSVITAAAYDLDSMVLGRFIQGVGGGGLIPPTLALVADAWPPERRGLPLGIVGAVQELGSVLGPLYGAVVIAFGDWRDIFWLNCIVGLVIAAAMSRLRDVAPQAPRIVVDWWGIALLVVSLVGLSLVMVAPDSLTTGVTSGRAFLPVVGDSRWLTPLAIATYLAFAAFCVRQATASEPLLAWGSWGEIVDQCDLLGAVFLAVSLGAVIITFASADPERAALSEQAPFLLPVAAVGLGGFLYRQRTATAPLVPRGALGDRAAWGSLVVSFFIGAALIAALVDIPFFARLTVHRDSQLDAALVLVRFLVALPIGAVLGGYLTRWVAPRVLTPVAMVMSAGAFVHMANWDRYALDDGLETISLVVAGLGFGLAIAPVNAALLAHTKDTVHGIASALLVVARMIGMLIGISALTTIGLRQFYAASAKVPPVADLCAGSPVACKAYRDALLDAGLTQLHTVFAGAAVCAAVAAILAACLLPSRR